MIPEDDGMSLGDGIATARRERARSQELIVWAQALLTAAAVSLEDARAARDLAQTLRESGRLASEHLAIGAPRAERSHSS
jgi:hypothetical protein